MKTKTFLTLLSGWVVLALIGCDPKDPIYNTPHPEKGALTLTTDWSGIGEGLTAPESYTVTAADYSGTLSGTVNRLNHLFSPAEIRVNVYNTAEHISVNGTTATVATATGNADGVGPFIQNTPGWLFASTDEMLIEKDREHFHTAVMQQQVRELTIMIEPTGGTTDRIERIEGWLTGAAASLNFADGSHDTPSNVEVQFAPIADGANAGKWAATVRLLGKAGEQQKLNAIIYFTGSTPASITLDSDLSTELAAFNVDKRKPFALGGTVVETPTETGFTATITDWQPISGSGTAN